MNKKREKKEKVKYKDARDRFQKIANRRAKRVITGMDLLTNMIPQPSYDVQEDDIETLVKALEESLEKFKQQCQSRLEGKSKTDVEDIFAKKDTDKSEEDTSTDENKDPTTE